MLDVVDASKRSDKNTVIALLDIEKAFDNVWHDGIVHKLRLPGFPPFIVGIVRGYLSRWTSAVYIGSERSDSYMNNAGVPEGSILGSLLYNVLAEGTGAALALCADDPAILYSAKARNHLRGGLQRRLDTVVRYLQDCGQQYQDSGASSPLQDGYSTGSFQCEGVQHKDE